MVVKKFEKKFSKKFKDTKKQKLTNNFEWDPTGESFSQNHTSEENGCFWGESVCENKRGGGILTAGGVVDALSATILRAFLHVRRLLVARREIRETVGFETNDGGGSVREERKVRLGRRGRVD